MKHAKRRAFLKKDENFFGYQSIIESVDKLCVKLAKSMKKQNRFKNLKRIFIYGELFGGVFPSKNNIANNNDDDNDVLVEPVQREIFYSPRLEFCAFDLMIEQENENDNDNSNTSFVEWDVAATLFDECDFLWARPLFVGSFGACMQFSNEFESTVPAQLGLPSPDNNYAEGVVLKPVKKVAMVETNKGTTRAILKSKPKRFAESVQNFNNAQTTGGHGEVRMTEFGFFQI